MSKITIALYELKTSGASWRLTLLDTLLNICFESTRADADVYCRLARKPSGEEYYKLILVYVDNILAISYKPERIIESISAAYEIKDGSAGPQEQYLGAQIYEHSPPDRTTAWAMTSQQSENAIETVKQLLLDDGEGLYLRKNVDIPFPTYRPELDITPAITG